MRSLPKFTGKNQEQKERNMRVQWQARRRNTHSNNEGSPSEYEFERTGDVGGLFYAILEDGKNGVMAARMS